MEIGKILIIIGSIILGVGLVTTTLTKYNLPLGKLPGDIIIEKKNFNFYMPITTSIILSIIITLIFLLIRIFRS